jgi:hypothetical protein
MNGRRLIVWWTAFAVIAVAGVGNARGEDSSAKAVDYLRDVKPLLRAKCFACHGALKQESGLRLDTAELAQKGGDSGPAIEPGNAEASLLFQRISASDELERMPAEAPPLAPEQVAILKTWIDQGAPAPADEQPERDPRDHWAFRAPVRPAIPSIRNSQPAIRNSIDVYLAAEHERQGITPVGEASKSALLRRVYLDLIGLPPTPAELEAFLADESPGAYERVVDRLLASPQYGERWGRHWMDVWRYADWYGRRNVPDVWNSAPQIWRWRDWIVRSLNEDKGYDRMVEEMLAGDEIAPDDPEASLATGYLIRNWYALNPNDWMRSNVEHTGKAFLGLTFNCAHCHDHKYDPIAQDDYFRFRAFFEPIGIRQDRAPGEADPGPFQEYQYSVLRKIQRLGAVRVFDKNPESPTWFYTGGDERNRVSERGSIEPGVPAALGGEVHIKQVALPPRAWYPGLQPEIHETILNESRAALAKSEAELLAARKSAEEALPPLREKLAKAETDFAAAAAAAAQAGKPGALAGKQSLVLNATTGRRALQNGLSSLKSLEDGASVKFQSRIIKDAHFNFQLAKDMNTGATATYIAFDQGRILSYHPGTFTELEVGRYDLAAGQDWFAVAFVLQTVADRCLLTVRDARSGETLVPETPVALNGWNPIGDPAKGIFFDARPGSVAIVDELALIGPGAASGEAERLVNFDFEPPIYADGRDVIGIDGWAASPFGAAPATSTVSSTALSAELADVALKVQAARREVESHELKVKWAEANQLARQAELASVEARIAADRVKHGEAEGDMESSCRAAAGAERNAAVKSAEAAVLLQEQLLATAEAKPADDPKRAAEIDTAAKQLAGARSTLEKAQAAQSDSSNSTSYTPLSATYPTNSTGRRRALAEWITNSNNPLTARVAVNHIWMRHFQAPLVATVYDFGRNGAAPTHPELLDWLAVELMESGWSMKHIHRLIVTSNAYRRSSANAEVGTRNAELGDPESPLPHSAFRIPHSIDPENKLLWRMNPGRMEAEVVRDSLLACAGRLDLAMFGQELENEQSLTTRRRSVYYSCHPEGNGKSELGAIFDAPDAGECYRRTRSIVPQQALALTNSQLVHEVSGDVAGDVWKELKEDGAKPQAFVEAAYRRILTRAPSETELELCCGFLAEQAEIARKSHSDQAEARARESLVRALLNHHEFVTIR